MSIITKHLREINETYFAHACHALYFALYSLFACIIFVLHAFLPFIFVVTGSNVISKLYNIIVIRRKYAQTQNAQRLAIIGFGASGIIKLYNIITENEECVQVDIFDKDFLSLGTAYNTSNISHLLNVKACNMSAVENNKHHFVGWLKSNGFSYLETDFVPRFIYGLYLKDLVCQAREIAKRKNINITFYNASVENVQHYNGYFLVENNIYSKCYLCIGATFEHAEKNYWNMTHEDIKMYIQNKENIHLVGLGLSAFDAVLAISTLGFGGKFILHSRTGRISSSHEDCASVNKIWQPFSLRNFILECRNSQNWRSIFDSVRPYSAEIWQSFSIAQKKTFIRHGLRYWNAHRHRAPALQYLKITQMIQNNSIILTKEKPPQTAIYCTGFNFKHTTNLEYKLIQNNMIKLDDIKMGIVSLDKNFVIIGAKNFGSLFETTAIPEIRKQASG